MNANTYTYLCEVARHSDIERIRRLLEDERIPFHDGLMVADPPRVVFTVPVSRLEDAQDLLRAEEALPPGSEELAREQGPARLPKNELQILGGLFFFHVVLVLANLGPLEGSLVRWGALVGDGTAMQPWRLFTSLLLHSGLSHAFWNGVSMVVFGIPLLSRLGLARSALIYFAAGVGGSITALAFAEAGTRIIGSSGAVAGLFGAWVVLSLARTRYAELVTRARIRTLGVALLFLPSLLSPVSSTGNPISVSSHLGGLTTGMIVGMLISRGLLSRLREALRSEGY